MRMTEDLDAELGHMTDSETGAWLVGFPSLRWIRPRRVLIVDDHLVFDWPELHEPQYIRRSPDVGTLLQFVTLAKGSPRQIQAFAARWSYLEAEPREWWTPPTSEAESHLRSEEKVRRRLHGYLNDIRPLLQPLTLWTETAARFAALLQIGLTLREERPCTDASVWAPLGKEKFRPQERDAAIQRNLLEGITGGEFRRADVGPLLRWQRGSWELSFGTSRTTEHGGSGLRASLLLQLCAALAGPVRLCGECARPFTFDSLRRGAPEKYCGRPCTAQRAADRKYKRKRKEGSSGKARKQ